MSGSKVAPKPVPLSIAMMVSTACISCGVSERTTTPNDARSGRPAVIATCAIATTSSPSPPQIPWRFVDRTEAAGLGSIDRTLAASDGTDDIHKVRSMLGAIASADLDNDCYPDLVLDRGAGGIALLRNSGDGTFEDRTAPSGISAEHGTSAGANTAGTLVLADLNGDDVDDLFVGGVGNTPARVFLADTEGLRFRKGAIPAGLSRPTYGAHLFDVDGDDDLDLFAGHWVLDPPIAQGQYLFRNDGNGAWTDITTTSGLADLKLNHVLTPRTTDLNRDGALDVLLVADFGLSKVLLNDGSGRFSDVTEPSISDENGMGSATGDIDNDGDIDWFVSGIYDPSGFGAQGWGGSGNRLYKSVAGDLPGAMSGGAPDAFVDRTDDAGVRQGGWGWGACMHDFDRDGFLDIFHVNGWPRDPAAPIEITDFSANRSVFFHADGAGAFTEAAGMLGLDNNRQGRGLVCADFDRDGDIDIVVANHQGPVSMYRNESPIAGWLTVRLRWRSGNHRGIGSRIVAHLGAKTMTREVGAGSNFMSHDPREAHFGLADARHVDRLVVHWPDGTQSEFGPLAGQRVVTVTANDL